MRRSVLRAAAALLAGSLALAGCSGGSESSEGDGVLNILVNKHSLTKPVAEMKWAEEVARRAGVTINWEEVSADWDQKKATLLAAGDVPDLIIGSNAITDSDLATYSSLFEDLSDDMSALPNVQAMLDAQPKLSIMATQPSGAVYGIPTYKRYWPETIGRQYINQKWLDNLGLSVPTTWDELYDVLVAFRDQDANGNGDPHDEIPWDWGPAATTGFANNHPTTLLHSLGIALEYGGGEGYFMENGKVSNFLTDPRYREVIRFVHRAYADGLVSRQVMTQDYSTYQSVARGEGETAAVGFGWGWTASDRFGAQLADQYTSMSPLLAEPNQTTPVAWSYDDENYASNTVLLSREVGGDKAAALALINAFYDQDISVQVLWGDFGSYVQKTGDKSYTVLPPADTTVDSSTWKWTNTLADLGPYWIRDDIEVVLPVDIVEAREESEPLEEAFSNIDPELDIYPSKSIKMTTEDENTLTLNNATILNLAMTKFGEWVTAGGVDEQWDDYVAQLQAAGLPQNVEIHQRYYDEYRAGR